jgi:nucleoid-associated protein YgaU
MQGAFVMGKEVKIGLSVIGTLFCALGGVVYKQINRAPEEPIAAAVAAAPTSLRSGPKYSSGPTVATSSASSTDNATDAAPTTESAGSGYGQPTPAAKDHAASPQPTPAATVANPFGSRSSDAAQGYSNSSAPDSSELGDTDPSDADLADTDQPTTDDSTQSLAGSPDDSQFAAEGADSSDYSNQPSDYATSDYSSQTSDDTGTPTPDDYLAADEPGAEEADTAPHAVNDRFQSANRLRQPATQDLSTADANGPSSSDPTNEAWNEPSDSSLAEPHAFQPDPEVQLTSAPPSSRRSAPRTAADNSSAYGSPSVAQTRTRAAQPTSAEPQTGYGNQQGYDNQSSYGADPTAPQSTGAAPAEPRDPGSEEYVVEPDENFWAIAKKTYGSGAYFKALYEYNRPQYPRSDQLRAGDVISVPPLSILERKYPHLCPRPADPEKTRLGNTRSISSNRHNSPVTAGGGPTYTVEEGDTLFDIARHELGKAGRWVEIYDLNRDQLGQDFDHLQPGTVLVLPGADDPRTTQPRAPLRR